jgi:hypothetical protein
MARTKQTRPCTKEKPPYSHRNIELARLGYALWAGVAIDFVSDLFVKESTYGVNGWANKLRGEMMQTIVAVRSSSAHTWLDLLSEDLIQYIVSI